MADPSQICTTPLSSPLSPLPRWHTHALALALLLPLPRGWLFRAALAAFTTRTAIFAAAAAAALLRPAPHAPAPAPLDALALLPALGLAALVACWLLLVAERETAARPLVRVWAVVVAVGCVLGFVGVERLGWGGGAGGEMEAECSGVWMSRAELFGELEGVPVLGLMGSKTTWFARRVGVPGLVFAALAIVAAVVSRKGPVGKVVASVDVEQNQMDVVKERGGPWAHLRWALSLFGTFLVLLLPAMAIFIIVSTEQFFFVVVPNLPSVEHMASVGQWDVWAATGVVVLATFVNTVRERTGLETPVVAVSEPNREEVEVKTECQ